ncbi:MAG TPA: prepilin peptidase [Clostridiales bacterium]|nr:prepilin peptidase [Clostridiales bacterium]HOL90861.1 prepilin peptidase [Clostridiales bacterium]HPP35245.1 prepilin peptidase [Clostridiales bacterium]
MAAYYVFIFILGLVVGSFVNVLIYRVPLHKSIVAPPSSCTSCGERLTVPDLIPVFSYIFLKGRCRHCGERISPRYPLVELLTAAMFVILFTRFGFTVPFIAYAYLMTILAAVFFIDIDHRIIPNGLVLAALAGGLAFFAWNCISPDPLVFGDEKWWTPLAGLLPGSGFLLLVAILGSLIYRTEDAMGMGDVKLMAPVGLFLGWRLCITALAVSVLLGGLVSMALILLGIKKRKDTVAFGPFIVAGTFVTMIWGWELTEWFFNYINA